MKKFLLLIGIVLLIASPAQAYIIAFEVPPTVEAGEPLVIEGTSNLPAGFTTGIILYRDIPNFPAREVTREEFTIQEDGTWSVTIDTTGFVEGNYRAEIPPNSEYSYGSGSVRMQAFTVSAAEATPAPTTSLPTGLPATAGEETLPTAQPTEEAPLGSAGAVLAFMGAAALLRRI